MAVLRKTEKPVLTVHFGDTHIGSTTALCPPIVRLDDGGEYRASREQRWFWDCWLRFWDDVSVLKRKYRARVVAIDGGDQREGDHHQTTGIWFVSSTDQDRAVVESR
ncbi:MAG: hypothetical protein KJ556_20795, partial [Gammaproteobacteria bacterium]|nr:hypothetical protein [Gammaproteobacteria bacterium]